MTDVILKERPAPKVDAHFDQLKKSTIMLVDDDPILMDLIKAYLEEEGYSNFILIEDSRQALTVLNAQKPDVLLLDLMMPHVDGYAILEEIRSDPLHRFLPVIVLTSSTDSESKLRALELGATDFLAKPVDSSELGLRLRNTLAVKVYQDELAYFDPVTRLPNRKSFLDRLEWHIKRNLRKQLPLVVLTISLDRFNEIKERLGPSAGDMLLSEFAGRLKTAVRKDDMIDVSDLSKNIARLGSDEFSVLLSEIEHEESAANVARRILEGLQEPFMVESQEVFLSASIGIALSPADGKEIDTLMKNAAVAIDHARQEGSDSYRFYSSAVDAKLRDLFTLKNELRRALDDDEFELYYQPKIEASSGRAVGFEALIRWNHKERGLISPEVFIPLAEEIGMIVPIGEWTLKQACLQTKQLEVEGFGKLKVSVNVSAPQIGHKNLCNAIQSALTTSGLAPSRLIIEITENLAMANVEESLAVLRAIKELGVSLSIDDFGTGYSSLAFLKRFPISELKIDKSFFDDVPGNAEASSIALAIIDLAHTLDLYVTAEGIEREDQVEFLRDYRCDIIQGYFYSQPLSVTDLKAFLAGRESGLVAS